MSVVVIVTLGNVMILMLVVLQTMIINANTQLKKKNYISHLQYNMNYKKTTSNLYYLYKIISLEL